MRRTNLSRSFDRLFDDGAGIAVERAVTELRAGRPVVVEAAIGTPAGAAAVAAIDTATPATFAVFAAQAAQGAALVLPGPRAHALGMAATGAVSVPLDGLDHAAACRLAAGEQAPCPVRWTEAEPAAAGGIALAKAALLLPAVLAVPVDAGTPLSPAVQRIALADLARTAEGESLPLQIVSRARVPVTDCPEADFVVFRGGPALRDQVAVVVGAPCPTAPVPVRLHSACLTGDLFGSLRCDCGDQLRRALPRLAAGGGGVLLYLDQEGRGTGIANKMRAYALQDRGLDTIDADAVLGYGPDERRYGLAAGMLRLLGYRRVRLFTNNPDKVAALTAAGLDVVGRSAIMGVVTDENRRYLAAKAARAGHLIDGMGEPPAACAGASRRPAPVR